MTRAIKPRSPIAIAPATVSQLSSLQTLGVDERRFLELVVPKCGHVSKLGRLRVVEVEEAIRVLRELSPAGEGEVETRVSSDAPPAEDPEEEEGGSLLTKLGRVRKTGANA